MINFHDMMTFHLAPLAGLKILLNQLFGVRQVILKTKGPIFTEFTVAIHGPQKMTLNYFKN